MGWIDRVLGRGTETGYAMKLVTEKGNGFYSWDGRLFRSDIVRACIRPKVHAIGKLTAKHVRAAQRQGDTIQINPDVRTRFMLEEPNPYMTGQLMLEKLASQLCLNNNAFALIVRDSEGYASQIYPIVAHGIEVTYGTAGELFLIFELPNGQRLKAPYTDVIHLRQDFHDNDLFGESPVGVIAPLMEVVTATDQGIVKAIKNSAVIRWLLKFKAKMRPEDRDLEVQRFIDKYLDVTSGGAAAGVDPGFDLEQVKPESYVPNAAQMDRTTTRLLSAFNTNEKIVQSKYTEDEWTAYYEAEIEPVAMQLAGEYTRKIFTRKERGFGNRIVFEASNLHYASMRTKLALKEMVDRGAMTPNEWREILNYAPIAGGDQVIRRLDTAAIKEGGGEDAEED